MPIKLNNASKRKRVLLAMYWWEERVFDGVARFATENNWILDSRMRWTHTDQFITPWRGDGIIANPGFTRPLKNLVSLIHDSGLPCVGLQKFGDYGSGARVVNDHRKVGEEGARHLISREFRNLAYVKCADNALERERLEGFKKIVLESDLRFYEVSCSELKNQLSQLPKPIGLMAANDFNAHDAMTVCIEAGYTIPHEIAIVGADDSKAFCEHTEIPLSSVRCRFEEQGYQAAVILDRLMRGEAPPETEYAIGTDGVTERKSTDTIAVEDELTRRTLAIIRERYRERLKVKDIAEMVGISPRSLQISFRDRLGFTMSSEIARLRTDFAKHLLLNTDQKVDTVAYECGFSGRHHFIRSFTREVGMTPTEFRKSANQSENS
ncbi:substrate-binding domain-containing protein [Pelagicoccus sp. SDUM812003]|uniref:substrate-binding domain-containing protein n=1 Tax=Pelagicoccus sp. SDUM812003 TaxID=3041267 RepID=UPI00280C9236|nr:substrate-binding domain-containing protein [Pelagicoccus sp. SDUM812003]MDQ8205014.1 substrate-binding domain-containing protein [Pelagicoccus sp. SDUM812003]